MAAVIPQRTGLALPAVRLNGGYFAVRSAHDTAWGDLIIAAFCPIGGRLMQRSFGSTVDTYLMAPADEFTMSSIRAAVFAAVSKYCPHIRLVSVDANVTKGNPNQIELVVAFQLAVSTQNTQTRLVRLDRRMVSNLLRIARST